MATEEYQLGYEAGYQDGWNAAQQPQRRPSYKEWTTDYVRDNLHKLKQPQAEAPVIAQNKAAPVASWDDSRTQKVYEVLTNDNYPPKGSADHWEGWKARLVVDALFPAQPQAEPYTYASKQATACADCGEHKHTPLRIDAMGGYVCLTCIDKKLGSLLGEFGYPEPQAEAVIIVQDGEICYKSKSDDQSYGMWCPVTPDADHGLANGTELYAAPQQAEAVPPKHATGWAAPKDRYTTPVLFNPYTGEPRNVLDVQSDPQGILIVPPGALISAAQGAKT